MPATTSWACRSRTRSDLDSEWRPPAGAVERFPGRRWELAWAHHPLARTWRVAAPTGVVDVFVKAAHGGARLDLLAERSRLRWAKPYLPVPELIACGEDAAVAWHATAALPGLPGVAAENTRDAHGLAVTLGRGLRQFHTAPASGCPFASWNAIAVERARANVRAGRFEPNDLLPEHQSFSIEAALAELESLVPQDEDLVVTHGDYCVPNVLISAGQVTGFVDIGALGVADRWRDIAVGTWSVTRNLGPGYEDAFLEGYGAPPDPARQRFYRLLYDLAGSF